MKKILLIMSMLLIAAFAYNQAPNTWTQKADFGGGSRDGAVGFSIGSKGYIGTGYDGISFFKDFWEYDPATDSWTQKADFRGTARNGAAGFSIGSKGYIGTGYPGYNNSVAKDFWEYNPIANTWTRKADFAGIGRVAAVGFSIGNKGYLGTGEDDVYFKDFWEYDPATDIWTRKADFGGTARIGAAGFSIGNKGYIGTGGSYDGTNTYLTKDFWEYDPVANVWMQKADFGGGDSWYLVGFSIGTKGYMGAGNVTKDFWEYDAVANTWKREADFGGTGRFDNVGFSIGTKGYVGIGQYNGSYYKDFWEYTPDGICTAPTNLSVPKIAVRGAVLQWTLPGYTVSAFQIRYHKAGDSVITSLHTAGTHTRFVIAPLSPNTTYEWQIRSNCATDTTNWVSGPDFTTLAPSAISSNTYSEDDAIVESNITVRIMPNPNKGNFTIQMQLPAKAASTTLILYNSQSVKVWQQDAGMLSGSVSRNINLESKLSPGVYVLIIQNGDTQLMQKVVVTK